MKPHILLSVGLIVSLNAAQAATIGDLQSDSSRTVNPNGAWSCNGEHVAQF